MAVPDQRPAGPERTMEPVTERGDEGHRTLVVVGEHDRTTPPAEVRQISQGIPGAEFQILDGCAHAAYLEQAEEYSAMLKRFLDRA